MTTEEKLGLIKGILEIKEGGELKETTLISELKDWDSLTQLEIVMIMEDEFNKELPSEIIKGFNVIKDILDYME